MPPQAAFLDDFSELEEDEEEDEEEEEEEDEIGFLLRGCSQAAHFKDGS